MIENLIIKILVYRIIKRLSLMNRFSARVRFRTTFKQPMIPDIDKSMPPFPTPANDYGQHQHRGKTLEEIVNEIINDRKIHGPGFTMKNA